MQTIMGQHLTLKWYLLMSLLLMCCVANAKTPVVASYYYAAGDSDAVSQLPVTKLTHILYAFIALCGDNSGAAEATHKAIEKSCKGKEPFSAVMVNRSESMSELTAFKKLKKDNPHLIVLPSFGGWGLSQPFHDMALSETGRKNFVKSAIKLIATHDVFDGIDIDWEYPGGGGKSQPILSFAKAQQEKVMFKVLMQEFRTALDELENKTGREYQLTAAVSGLSEKTKAIDWNATIPFMNYVFVMSYDFATNNSKAAHHTNLFSANKNTQSTEAMVNNLLNAGVAAHKLAVGVAFYGRGWTNSDWQGQGFGSNEKAITTGTYTYKELITNPPQGYTYGYDQKSQAAYFYNLDNQGFISFDDTRSVLAKAKWAKEQGLAGVFSWQIMQDNGDLLEAMYRGVHQ